MNFNIYNELKQTKLSCAIGASYIAIKALTHGNLYSNFVVCYGPKANEVAIANAILKEIERLESASLNEISHSKKLKYILEIDSTISSLIRSNINFTNERVSKLLSDIRLVDVPLS